LKNPQKAYRYLMNAVFRGVTFFDEVVAFFAANYKELAPEFLKMKSLGVEATQEKQ
jgi:hypothetical protein